MSELTHIFLCAVLKSLEIALQAHFSIKDTLAISECRNDLICCPSLSLSSIKTDNRRIMRHNSLCLVIRHFRRTECSEE